MLCDKSFNSNLQNQKHLYCILITSIAKWFTLNQSMDDILNTKNTIHCQYIPIWKCTMTTYCMNADLLHECRLITIMMTYCMNADLLHECRLIAWMPTYCMNADLLHECRLITWMTTYYKKDDLLHEQRFITWIKTYYMKKDLIYFWRWYKNVYGR